MPPHCVAVDFVKRHRPRNRQPAKPVCSAPSRYARGIPASIKNRGPGERAHRRWRKSRASGRKAA